MRRTGTGRRANHAAYRVEALEARRLLTLIIGTDGDDVIVVEHNGATTNWTMNGQGDFRPLISGTIEVRGGLGNDHITIVKTTFNSRVELQGGPGRDTFVVGGGDLDANVAASSSLFGLGIVVSDGSQEDSIIIDDSQDAGNDTYNFINVTGGTVDEPREFRHLAKGSEPFISFDDDLKGITLRANSGSNVINVDMAMPFTLTATLTIEANAGNDTVNMNRRVNGQGRTVAEGLTRVIVAGGEGNDVFNMTQDAFQASIDFRGGNGADTFNFDLANDATKIYGIEVATFRFDGGDGADHLIFDIAGPGNFFDSAPIPTRDLTSTTLHDVINYIAVETLDITAEEGEERFVVSSTAPGSSVTINGAGGNDVFEAGGSSVTDNVDGPLRLNGQAGSDTLVMSQGFDGTGQVYTLTANALRSTTFNFLTFSSMQAVDLSTGNQASTIFIDSTAYALTLNTRNGVDDVVITDLTLVNGTVDLVSPLIGDNLTIDAGVGTIAETYTIGDQSFDATGFSSLTYAELNTLFVLGNAGDNVFNVAPGIDLVALNVHGGAGNDTFNVTPSATATIDVDGDSPTTAPGDKLILNPEGTTGLRHVAGAAGSGTFFFTNRLAVSHESIDVRQVIPFAPTFLNLLSADDTGVSSSDNITSDTSLTFIGLAADGHTITLRADAAVIGAGTSTSTGAWSIPTTFTADGTYLITATATDPATGLVSAASAALTLVVDRAAPTALTAAPDLQAASDTGISDVDNITADITPQFTITNPPETFFRLFRNGVLDGSAFRTGNSPQAASVVEGVNTFTYRFVDAAGNLGTSSQSLAITVDTIAPAAPGAPDLATTSDLGLSSSDNLTRVSQPEFTGAVAPGTLVRLLFDGLAIGLDVTTSDGLFSVVPQSLVSEGVRSVSLRNEDVAGNTSAIGPALVVTFDFTPPPVPGEPDLITASDTGVRSDDDITKETTPTFTARTPSGPHAVQLFAGNTLLVSGGPFADGTYTLTTRALSNGNHDIQAVFMDAAGNFSGRGPAQRITIDTAGPFISASNFIGHPQSRLSLTFSEDVPNLAAPMLTLVNLSTGATVGQVALAYAPNTGVFTFLENGGVLPAASYRATVATQVRDIAGNAPPGPQSVVFTQFAQVVGRRVFFNSSALDGNDPAANAADDAAVAAGKLALLPGQTASLAHITNFSKGLNGIMIDVAGLPTGAAPSAADFALHVGDGTTFVPVSAAVAVASRPAGGSITRLTLTLPDGAVRNTWLRVTTITTANTGLAAPGVFYFGNLAGDTGGLGTPAVNATNLAGGPGTPIVNVTDLARTRANIGSTTASALAASDFNRDGTINATDVAISRIHQRRSLPLFTAPLNTPAAAAFSDVAVTIAPPTRTPTRPPRRGLLDGDSSLLSA